MKAFVGKEGSDLTVEFPDWDPEDFKMDGAAHMNPDETKDLITQLLIMREQMMTSGKWPVR